MRGGHQLAAGPGRRTSPGGCRRCAPRRWCRPAAFTRGDQRGHVELGLRPVRDPDALAGRRRSGRSPWRPAGSGAGSAASGDGRRRERLRDVRLCSAPARSARGSRPAAARAAPGAGRSAAAAGEAAAVGGAVDGRRGRADGGRARRRRRGLAVGGTALSADAADSPASLGLDAGRRRPSPRRRRRPHRRPAGARGGSAPAQCADKPDAPVAPVRRRGDGDAVR